MPPSYVATKKRKAKADTRFPLDARLIPRQAFAVIRPMPPHGRPGTALPAALCALIALGARAQTVPGLAPIESRAMVRPGGQISVPFMIENPNERRVDCGILFNFRDRPIWEGAAKLDPREQLRHTAEIDSRHFTFDARPVRARIAAVVEMSDERQSLPMEIVFAPLLPLQPQCRFRIRGQHRIDGPPHRSDLLAEASLHPDGAGLRCRLLRAAAPADTSWEILFLPLSPDRPASEASHLIIRHGPAAGHSIDVASGPRPEIRLESPPEAADGRVLDVIFPSGSAESVSLQIVLWLREGDATEGYCAFAGNLDQARDPAYAPELVPRDTGPTHRAWVRAASP